MLTPEEIIAQASDIAEVQAGYTKALAVAETLVAEHKTDLENAEKLYEAHRQALHQAEETGRRATEAVQQMQAYAEALDHIRDAAKFLTILQSN